MADPKPPPPVMPAPSGIYVNVPVDPRTAEAIGRLFGQVSTVVHAVRELAAGVQAFADAAEKEAAKLTEGKPRAKRRKSARRR